MRIAIVGGCGYIGSRLFQYLTDLGYSVDTIDLEWFGNYVNPNNIKVNFKDLDKQFWAQYNSIILLAGHSSVQMCKDRMVASFENNVYNFVHLLEKLTLQKLIYAGSSSVYGSTGDTPAPENWDRFSPDSYYDLTKKIISYYSKLSERRCYELRMGTVAGASPNLRVDIMVNKMYDTAKRTGQITIFNSHIYRPILGILDLCKAVACMLETDHYDIYNLASLNANVDDISKAVAKTLGNIDIINTGNSPTYDFSIDTSKFQSTYSFKFQDSIESIVESLKETYETSNKGVRL